MSHRLFAACPIPDAAAGNLADWSSESFAQSGFRLLDPAQMHVTVLFFGAVSLELQSALIELVSQVSWPRLEVSIGKTSLFGASAIGINLSAAASELANLRNELSRFAAGPLGHLARLAADLDRMDLRPRPLKLHLTVARLRPRQRAPLAFPQAPLLHFSLDRLVLYESLLSNSGASYRALAESRL